MKRGFILSVVIKEAVKIVFIVGIRGVSTVTIYVHFYGELFQHQVRV